MANGKELFDEIKSQMETFTENGTKFYLVGNKDAGQRARVAIDAISKLKTPWKRACLHGEK